MKLTIVQVSAFVSEWRKLRLTDADLSALEQIIMDNPQAGSVMAGTGGIRKIRFAPPSWNTGKSGATRVCYVVFGGLGAAYLLTLFAKNEKSNLSAEEKAMYRKWMKMMKDRLAE
ncbi:MAG TPA: type II toxin-antitoxin system RelE/ParE family toxin [Humisphaera sp.]|nr:type II toxin-antitoxin system RelE/ParE family toxin [Humisphaera sp.]